MRSVPIWKNTLVMLKPTMTESTINVRNLGGLNMETIETKYPHLIPSTNALAGYVLAAKNIRKELAIAFPGVKFSVRGKSYSMGNSIRVEWTDGPTVKQVDKIVDKYSAGTFDGMTDCYNYSKTDFNKTFGSSKYIMPNRHYSDKLIAKAIEELTAEYASAKDPAPSVNDYKMGYATNVTPMGNTNGSHHWSWQSVIYRHLEGLGDYGI